MAVMYFDIGNTNLKIGVEREDHSLVSYVLPSNEQQTADQLGIALAAILRHIGLAPEDVTGAVASSVVPGMSSLLSQACRRFAGIAPLFAPEEMPVPLENRYTLAHEVGADRLVGAYAARRLFPDAASVISVDYGTATTFDCVEDNAYLGGLICPGVLSSCNALAANTAKLPRISLDVTEDGPHPGRSTAVSLRHGFVFGFAAMTEGLTARLSESLRGPVTVIGTGGFASALARVTSCFDAVLPDLVLEGLRLLYKERHAG